jgi:transcriptional regulator
MYIPAFNQVHDKEKIDAFIDAHGFATVITEKEGRLWASHLPVLLDKAGEGSRVLRSHMARANEQWQHFSPDREVLCIFHGPHAYITPAWYEMQHTVPTWNYAAIHVYGMASIVADGALEQIVYDTTAKYESSRPSPWKVPLSADETRQMLAAVVGFTIEVTRVEAKFKLGQNRSKEDQAGLLRGLLASPDSGSQELAKLILAQTQAPRENKAKPSPYP